MKNYRQQDLVGADGPSSMDGKDVRDTKQLKGEASQDSLHGTNTVKIHSSGKVPKGQGAEGGSPYARK